MERMNDLRDLLKHEIMDLYSAESQIIDALPTMIDKAKNTDLKKALQDHLRVTEKQRSRLEQAQNMLGNEEENTSQNKNANQNNGLFSRLFKGRQVCRGMQGIIEEGTKVMKEDMDRDVMDAAIIGCAQKIEHYEISGYGTARTFARQLNLEQVAQLLEQTLNEEYNADDMLTQLAEGHINEEAESGRNRKTGSQMQSRTAGSRTGTQERARRAEPEMEMASNRNRSGATASRTTAAGRTSTAPKGTGSRSTVAANRNTASTKRSTSNTTNSKTESRSTRGGSSSGRSTGTGRNR